MDENLLFATARERMVAEQLMSREISDRKVLTAMRTVPRHCFVPSELRHLAYEDRPLQIGAGQTISQPYMVALMSQLLRVTSGMRVLEIGAGSGYQAAILAEMGAEVDTIEIVEPLADQASATLRELGYSSARVHHGDGEAGWPDHAPFDRMIVTCAPSKIPPVLVQQLREGGLMAIPIGDEGETQQLYLAEKIKGELCLQPMAAVRFVPMTGTIQDG